MSGVKPITSYFKVLTKDELEIEELKESQSSSLSRVISNQSARTCSTLSTKVYDTYIDLTKEPEEPMPALADYSSDDDDDDVIPVATTVGDSIFSAEYGGQCHEALDSRIRGARNGSSWNACNEGGYQRMFLPS
jgi:hypothetical protein